MEVDQKSLVSCCALVLRVWLLAEAEQVYLNSYNCAQWEQQSS